MKFVMTQAVCKEGMQKLEGKVDIYIADNPDPNNYLDQMQDADALIVRLAKCDAHAIENSPQLKVIGRTGIGYDSVDVNKATSLGIPVVITPGASIRSVAEHTIALILALSKNIVEAHNEMRAGNWEIRNAHKAFDLQDKVVGIAGLGPIGRETAKLCQGLGMKVSGYDPFFTKEQIEALDIVHCSTIEQLVQEADIVSVHMPLVEATRNLITAREISKMKPTAVIINSSRGGIVNEKDLAEALKAGVIAGAGLDVFEEEPASVGNPLLNCPNVIVSPHSAAQTRETVVRVADMCIEGCLAILNGEKWPHVVDKSVYDHPRWK